MSKPLNEDTITNELKGASAFFSKRPAPPSSHDESSQPNDRTTERTVVPPIERTDKRSVNRTVVHTDAVIGTVSIADEIERGEMGGLEVTERYSFEVYTHQKKRLERICFKYRERTGKRLTASRLIREALEPHLAQLEVLLDEE